CLLVCIGGWKSLAEPAIPLHSECEASFSRRTLLRLSLLLCHSEPVQFAERADKRDLRIHQNRPPDDERLAAGIWRSRLGRRTAPTSHGVAARLQRNAQR